jgi:hypothetical protein
MLDTIIAKRSKGNKIMLDIIHTRLVLRGLDPDKFSSTTPDDAELIDRVRNLAAELNITL